jgi:dihydrofolate reductase
MNGSMINDEKMGASLGADLLKTADTMLVGRKMYQGFEQYWPGVPKKPGNTPDLIVFSQWMADTVKVILP